MKPTLSLGSNLTLKKVYTCQKDQKKTFTDRVFY